MPRRSSRPIKPKAIRASDIPRDFQKVANGKGALSKFDLMTIQAFLDDYMESGFMKLDWQRMKPGERLSLAERLLNYFAPKRQATTSVVAVRDSNALIEDTLRILAEENER